MGIKDKVLNILFDDEEEEGKNGTQTKHKQKDYDASSFLKVAPVFIDVNPSNRSSSNTHSTDSIPSNYIKEEINEINDTSEYTYTANISPIFGVVDKKNKAKNKNVNKIKNFSGVKDKKNNPGSTTQQNFYADIILSPIFGPLITKEAKKANKTRKKEDNELDRNISDTGSFEVEYEEGTQEEIPSFDGAVENEPIEENETIGDTDRLERISDRINQIKNEAATIYSEKDEQSDAIIVEEKEPVPVDNSISNLIHNFQLKDYDDTYSSASEPSHQEPILDETATSDSIYEEQVEPEIVYDEPSEETNSEPIENDDDEPSFEDIQESSFNDNNTVSDPSFGSFEEEPFDSDLTQSTTEEEPIDKDAVNSNPTTSIDDLFQDDVDEGKDLFSELFGDDL